MGIRATLRVRYIGAHEGRLVVAPMLLLLDLDLDLDLGELEVVLARGARIVFLRPGHVQRSAPTLPTWGGWPSWPSTSEPAV